MNTNTAKSYPAPHYGTRCEICGHESHCGARLVKEFKDGDGMPITIEVCKLCTCEECKGK